MIRILIVDDHLAIRIGLTSILKTQSEMEVIASTASGEKALVILEQQKPDIMLLDLRMQRMDGIDLLEKIAEKQFPIRTIILTSYETDEDVYRAVNAGAQGYLLKDSSEEELFDAILTVHSGRSYLPQHIAVRLADRMRRASLSQREMEVLEMMAEGLTNKQIGAALGISDHTVRSHVANITRKLEVADRTEAVTIAIKLGVLKLQ